MKVAVYRLSDGIVTGWLAGEQVPAPDEGCGHLDIGDDVDPIGSAVMDGALTARAPDLADLRAARWADAKAYRARRMAAGCMTPIGAVQTDDASRDAINAAATAAMIAKVTGATFGVTWTLSDNSLRALTVAETMQMAMTVAMFFDACQRASGAVRTAIDAAATPAALTAIDITAGYPA